jgi:hypothetical protein
MLMHKEQRQRQHHLKSKNIISKLAVIVLSIVLLTGISLVPALQIGANGQVQQQQPQQQKQVGLSQVIKQIAQQVVTANPGTSATHVQQILVQLAKQTAQTASQVEAIKEIRQISSQVATYPFGTLSQVLSYFAQQVASGNSNVVQIVQQTIQDKASSISNNITQSLSNVAVQQASGGSKNVNLVIRNAAQILANSAGVPVEKVEAVIIQIALQFARAQGRAITGQYIFQIANQIIQDPNGVLAQAILQLVLQDNVGKSSQTTTIIKNVIRISRDGDSSDERPRPPNKQLALSISFAKDPITPKSTQTVIVTVTDASTKSPISGVSVSGTITYASGVTTKTFSGTTDGSGKVSNSFEIGPASKTGTFRVSVQASKAGYQATSAKSSFQVTEVVPPSPCDPSENQTCSPSPLPPGGNDTIPDPSTCTSYQYYDTSQKKCVTPPPPDFACLANTYMSYDPTEKQWKCIPLDPTPPPPPPPTCPPGQHYDLVTGKCVDDTPPDLCEDPNAEGCTPAPDPCIENPTAEGCLIPIPPPPPDCEEDPTAEGCTPPPEQEEEVEEEEDVEAEESEQEEDASEDSDEESSSSGEAEEEEESESESESEESSSDEEESSSSEDESSAEDEEE